MLCFLC
jgi:hypothetical protein